MELDHPVEIPQKTFFTIAEVARITSVKAHVLRYWESQFSLLHPDKSRGNRRAYRRQDIETILLIKELLYRRKFSIEGARKHMAELRRQGELKEALVPRVALTEEQVAALVEARDELKVLRDLLAL